MERPIADNSDRPECGGAKTKPRWRSCRWKVITGNYMQVEGNYCNGIRSAPIADNSDRRIMGG